ncbi:MAG: hypothetical protein VYA17_01115 [Pseudomonadota bacterium]|nr:hypothetical protein [Pseudomonadota bacterium]
MAYANVPIEMANDLPIVTLNEPNHLNPTTYQMSETPRECFKNTKGESTVPAILINRAGGEALYTGANILKRKVRTLDSKMGASTNHNFNKERPSARVIRHACTHL